MFVHFADDRSWTKQQRRKEPLCKHLDTALGHRAIPPVTGQGMGLDRGM